MANPERHQLNNAEQLEGMNLRLIDADELLKAPFRIEGKFGGKYPFEAITVRMIEAAPTVEAAPVVHGHWESFTTSAFIGMDEDGEPKWADRRFFVHKECGRRSAIKEKYCPNCGTKMDL